MSEESVSSIFASEERGVVVRDDHAQDSARDNHDDRADVEDENRDECSEQDDEGERAFDGFFREVENRVRQERGDRDIDAFEGFLHPNDVVEVRDTQRDERDDDN